MAGAFSLVNMLADATGPGVPGFPYSAGVENYNDGHGSYLFFITSGIFN